MILNCFLFAFAMTAACKSYLALKVENFLPHVSFIYLCFFFIIYRSPSSFSICVKFSPGYTRLNSVRAVTLTRSRPISVLYLLSKGSLPEDIIESNEDASLTICQQASSTIVHGADVSHVNGASFSPVIVGRLHCGDNVVLALNSKGL